MILQKQSRAQKYDGKVWDKFAWLPVRLRTGELIWLERYKQNTWWNAYYQEVDRHNYRWS